MPRKAFSSVALRSLLLSACLALGTAAVAAEPAAPAAGDMPPPPPVHDGQFRDGPPPGPGFGAPMPFLHGIELSEAQQDALFALMHEQAPTLYEKGKQLRHAREDLAKLGDAAQFDDARAKTLADTLGRLTGELALLHARTEQRVMQVLTPEQRQQLAKMKQRHPSMRGPGEHKERQGERPEMRGAPRP